MKKNVLNVFVVSIMCVVEHYHCDNGHFADRVFIDDVTKKGQTISYCAAYDIFKMGRQKRQLEMCNIWREQMLLHAKARW